MRARSTSDRANNLPGTLLGTAVIVNCVVDDDGGAAAPYPGSPGGCWGVITLPPTLSADTYTFVGQYSGMCPR